MVRTDCACATVAASAAAPVDAPRGTLLRTSTRPLGGSDGFCGSGGDAWARVVGVVDRVGGDLGRSTIGEAAAATTMGGDCGRACGVAVADLARGDRALGGDP
jgi:hypothetical protein